MDLPEGLFTHERRVHFGDSDAARIVYTPRFLEYAMEALEIFMADWIGYDWYHINRVHGFGTPFVRIGMEIKAPLRPGDRVMIRVLVDKVGGSSLHFRTVGVRKDGVTAFETSFVCVVADQEAEKAVPIPAPMRARLEAYRDRLAAMAEAAQ
ncbi:MAG: acyl-CoA thioesterase [Magnetospirillum sp.]|nr:acyl-CoA thioesterase [Magnetospirillum sp.]